MNPTKTIEALKNAYFGESSASAKYTAYSATALAEGHNYAALLFKAAAKAEEYHARNHKTVLIKLGVTDPKPGTYAGTPGSTAENLQDAISGETYEIETMYPTMLKDARSEDQKAAIQSMSNAMEVEKQHAKLYKEALATLNDPSSVAAIFVCVNCGETILSVAPDSCPVCGYPGETFNKITL